ncbi:MAG: hypothetical protein PVI06_07945 [Desulfobacterales bacterium]
MSVLASFPLNREAKRSARFAIALRCAYDLKAVEEILFQNKNKKKDVNNYNPTYKDLRNLCFGTSDRREVFSAVDMQKNKREELALTVLWGGSRSL